jgi:hypothetical protein
MAEPLIPLPGPGEQSPENFLQMSRRAVQRSRIHLTEGDRLQASKKISGAVASALKAIGSHRRWRQDSHGLRDAIVIQLAAELGRPTPSAQTLFPGRRTAADHHRNYFANTLDEVEIADDKPVAESFLQAIDRLVNEPPKPYTVEKSPDVRRIAQLTGHEPPIGATDALGFANFTGELRECQ